MRENGYLEVAGKAVALAGALLPAVGFLVRYIAFALDASIYFPVQVALAAPLVLLAFTGLASLLNFISYVLLFGIVSSIAPSLQRVTTLSDRSRGLKQRVDELESKVDDPSQQESVASELAEVRTELKEMRRALSDLENVQPWKSFRWFQESIGPTMVPWFWRLSNLALGIPVVAGLLFIRPWLLPLLSFATSLSCLFVLMRAARRHGRLTLSNVWPALLILLSVSAVSTGLKGAVPGVVRGNFTFSSMGTGPGLDTGPYVQLGETDRVIHLQDCRSVPPTTFSVRAELVDSVRFSPPPSLDAGPNLWAILFEGGELRLGHRSC